MVEFLSAIGHDSLQLFKRVDFFFFNFVCVCRRTMFSYMFESNERKKETLSMNARDLVACVCVMTRKDMREEKGSERGRKNLLY